MPPLSRPLTGLRTTALLVALTAVLSLLAAAPAGAVVKEVEETKVGLQPRNATSFADGMVAFEEGKLVENAAPKTFENPAGNPVLHQANTYVVYWDPAARYHGDWREIIDTFLHNAGLDSRNLGTVFGVQSQYTDRSNKPATTTSALKASYDDTEPYPAEGCTDPHPLTEWKPFNTKKLTCLTDGQVRQGLQNFINQHSLPKGMSSVFYVLTPPGVTVCLDAGGATGHCSDFSASKGEEETEKIVTASYKNSFCSYHAAVNPGGLATGDANTVIYGVVPWTAGGFGDGQFAGADQTRANYCQDGGFDPSSKPIEQREKAPAVLEEPNRVQCPSHDGFCDAGLADLIVNQIAVEQQNTVTNPLLNAWQDVTRNESTDECRNFFAPTLGGSSTPESASEVGTLFNQLLGGHPYYLNNAFNLAAMKLNYPAVPCLGGISLEPLFTAPNTVNAGDVVGFDGMESTISLNSNTQFGPGGEPLPNYAKFAWNFGDGSAEVTGSAPGSPPCEGQWLPPCAASVFHSYQYGGVYNVTLTATDVGGNVASVSHAVTVVGPPPPSKEAAPGGSGSGSGAAGASPAPAAGSSPGGSPAGKGVTAPNPVAAAAVVSRSLKGVKRNGLVVRFSVNEQVAGHFEVLLGRATARRLGIGGAPAVGLPAGSLPALVIGKALLVTTQGGRSQVVIHLSKRTVTRLSRMHSVTLTLRLIVRNASSRSPATTTVLSTFTLTN